MAKTTDRLLSGVKRRAVIPSSQQLLDDTDMLELSDDAMECVVVPLIKSLRQEYFVIQGEDIDIEADVDSYSIPPRAVGRTLRDLKIVDSSGALRDLTLMAPEDAHLFVNGSSPHSFYFRGDKIITVPVTSETGLALRPFYEVRPSNHVVIADAGLITAVTSTTVTVNSAPDTIATDTVVDFIQGVSGCSILGMDVTVSNVSGTTYTFAAGDIPTSVAIGDYVSVAGTTPVLQIPDECYPLLETATAKRILHVIGDYEGATALAETEESEIKSVKTLLEPRITGENTIVINRHGLLRGRRQGWRRWLTY